MTMSIQADLPEMDAAEGQFRQTLNALEAVLDQLDADLQASLIAWTGDARDAYHAAHAQWKAAADDMVRKLAWLHGVISTAHANFSSARSTNVAMWRGNA